MSRPVIGVEGTTSGRRQTISAHMAAMLRAVESRTAYWCSWSTTHGARVRAAAERLRAAGRARIIDYERKTNGTRQFVVIPPDAEWNFHSAEIRK